MATEEQREWCDSAADTRPAGWSRPVLTTAQRQEIRRRLTDGEKAVDLAAEYGVSRGAINSNR